MSVCPVFRRIFFPACLLAASGCAFGHHYSYDQASLSLMASGGGTIAVATYDLRPYVLTRTARPEYVGLAHTGSRKAFPVGTRSERPLADDMTGVICRGLNGKGFQCVAVDSAVAETQEGIQGGLKKTGAKRALLLVLNEWNSDTHIETTLAYDAYLAVFDENGTRLAEARVRGRDVLGSSHWNPVGLAHREVPKAYQKKLEDLLNDSSVVAALQSS